MYNEIKQACEAYGLIKEQSKLLDQFKNAKINNICKLPEIRKQIEALVVNLPPREKKLCLVLVVAYLYSPFSFIEGHYLVNGLRTPLAACVGCGITEASALFAEAKHRYNLLPKFREQVEIISEQITKQPPLTAIFDQLADN